MASSKFNATRLYNYSVMSTRRSPRKQFVIALGISALVSVVLFVYGAYRNQSWDYTYLIWNLMLACLPLVFAVWLVSVLRRSSADI